MRTGKVSEIFILPLEAIAIALRTHQRRVQLGDVLSSLCELARCADLHRDTLYQVLSGKRISLASQIKLSLMLKRLQSDGPVPSRIMHIELYKGRATLNFGIGPVGALRR